MKAFSYYLFLALFTIITLSEGVAAIDPPGNLVATDNTSTSITLDWDDVINAAYYNISRTNESIWFNSTPINFDGNVTAAEYPGAYRYYFESPNGFDANGNQYFTNVFMQYNTTHLMFASTAFDFDNSTSDDYMEFGFTPNDGVSEVNSGDKAWRIYENGLVDFNIGADKITGQRSEGYYPAWNRNVHFEILNTTTMQHTNSEVVSGNITVRLHLPASFTGDEKKELRVNRNNGGSAIATYTLAKNGTDSSGLNIWEKNFTITTAGNYTLQATVQDDDGDYQIVYGQLAVGITGTRYFIKTYSDPNYSIEADTFGENSIVYVKIYTGVNRTIYIAELSNYNGTAFTLTRNNVTYNSSTRTITFSVNLNQSVSTIGTSDQFLNFRVQTPSSTFSGATQIAMFGDWEGWRPTNSTALINGSGSSSFYDVEAIVPLSEIDTITNGTQKRMFIESECTLFGAETDIAERLYPFDNTTGEDKSTWQLITFRNDTNKTDLHSDFYIFRANVTASTYVFGGLFMNRIYGFAVTAANGSDESDPSDILFASTSNELTYFIEGYVLNNTGNPIQGVAIGDNQTISHVITNESGYYRLYDYPNGSYLITAIKTNYTTNSILVTITGSNQSDANITLHQQPILDHIGDRNITENQTLYFNLTATSPDLLPLTFSCSASDPDVCANFNASTGNGSYTSESGEVMGGNTSIHTVVFGVSDSNGETANETITIILTDATPPSVISNTNNVNVTNGSAPSLNATITDLGSGVSNATVNVSAINSSSINEAILNYNATSDSWINDTIIADIGTGGFVNLTITAYDILGNVNNSVNMTVLVNEIRGVNLTNLTALEASTPAGTNATYVLNLTNNGTDADSYTITITNSGTASVAGINVSSPVNLGAGASQVFSLNVTNSVSGTFQVNVTATSENSSSTFAYINTTTIVTAAGAPDITSFAPTSPVNDIPGASRIFNITTNQTVNVTWYINGTFAQFNESVSDANYTNISAVAGFWNVTAIANNTNGTVSQTWDWNVTTDISVCITISSPGEYVLTQSITDSAASSCINITSSDVIFDGAGYTIDGVNASNTWGVYVYNSTTTLTNVTVTNLSLTNWERGIYLRSSSNSALTSNIASSNNGTGIYIESSGSNNLTGNNVLGNGINGIYLRSSSNNTLSGNNASNNNENGIYLQTSSKYNMLSGNNVTNNSINGISLDTSCDSNTVSGNNALNNINNGIVLSSSINNTIYGNNASYNSQYGIRMFSSSNNTIYNNYFTNTHNALDGGINIWNTTKTAGTNIINGTFLGGNYWSDYTGMDTDGDGLGNTQLPYNSSGSITNGGDYLPLAPQQWMLFNISGYKNNTIGLGLQNWNITLYNATNGTYMVNDLTNDTGFYEFQNLAPGIYNVTEVMQNSWMNVTAASQNVTITDSDAVGVNFTNQKLYNISGYKNNTQGTKLPNWNITLYNSTGSFIANNLTNASGYYKIQNLAPGTYNVTEVMQNGWANVTSISQNVTITNSDVPGVNFTNQQLFNISGYKNNTEGERLSGWNITLYNATNGTYILNNITNISGFYEFRYLAPGTYNVTEVMQSNWTNVTPISQNVTINNSDETGVNFTNQQLSIAGSAPTSPVNNIVGANRTFNITINQIVNVSWYINGTLVQTNPNVPAYTLVNYTNTSAVEGFWNITAIANNSNGTVSRTWYWNVTTVTPGVIVFFDDVESGTNNWTTTGLWHITTKRNNSLTHAWWYGQESTGNYLIGGMHSVPNSGNLTSPAINLGEVSNPVLSFARWYQVEGNCSGCNPVIYDQMIVLISDDNGSNWTQLMKILDSPYVPQWKVNTIDLSNYTGKTIKIRFYFDTIDAVENNYEGWYIDDVKVETPAPPLYVSLFESPDPVTLGNTSIVTVHVNTTGGTNVSNASVHVSATGGSLSPADGITDANGNFISNYTAPMVTANTTYTISVTASKTGYASGTGNDTISIISGHPLYVSVSESPDQVTSDNISIVTVHVNTTGDINVSNAFVNVSATGGSLNPASGTTDANGDFMSNYTAPTVTVNTVYTISATASKTNYSNGSGNDTITVISGPPLYVSVSESPDPVISGNTSIVTIHVNTTEDTNVSNAFVNISATGGILNPTSGTTDENGNFVSNYTAPTVNANIVYTISATASKTAYAGSAGNDTITVNPPPLPPGIIFFDNVESGTNAWTATGLWHITTKRNYSLTHAWWYGQESTGNYYTGARNSGYLTSGAISLAGVTNPRLSFMSWYKTEDNGTAWDKKIVQISQNGGVTWIDLKQISDTLSQWNLETINLSSYSGTTIKIRFFFDTMDGVNNKEEGWYIDDVVIETPAPPLYVSLFEAPDPVGSGNISIVVVHVNTTGGTNVSEASVNISVPGGILNPANGITDANGDFRSNYTAPMVNANTTYTISATASRVSYANGFGSDTITVNAGPPLYVAVSKSQDPIISGTGAIVTIHVNTTEGANISNASVNISANGGSLSPANGTTDANGDFISNYTAPTVNANTTFTISATASKTDYADGTGNDTIRVNSGPPLYVSVSESPDPITSGNIAIVTVHVNTTGGANISNASVNISATGGSLSPANGTTDANGDFISNYTAPNVTVNTIFTISAAVSMIGYANGAGNDTITVNLTPLPAGIYFFDDIESGANNWTTTGLWHISTKRYNSSNHSWWYGQESTGNYYLTSGKQSIQNSGNLTSQAINLSGVSNPVLSFARWYQVEGNCSGCNSTIYDQMNVLISDNNGSTWTQLIKILDSPYVPQWKVNNINLSNYTGKTIKIRFYFDTIDAVENKFEGWYIDDVKIENLASIDLEPLDTGYSINNAMQATTIKRSQYE